MSSTKKQSDSQLNTNEPLWHFFFESLFSFFRRLSSDISPLSNHSALSSLPSSSSSPKRKRERREKLHKGGGTAERRETLLRSLFIIVLLYFYRYLFCV